MSDQPGRAGDHEDVTEEGVAEEEAERDDAGRDADEPGTAGWHLQAAIFGGIAAFIAVIGVVYWFLSYEHAGSTFLALTAAMALLTAAYVGWPRRAHDGDDADHEMGLPAHGASGAGPLGPGEPGHDPHDGVWFPEASIWPVAIGAGMVLVGNGLLLGRWLLLPAGVFLVWALAGMIRQGRHRV